MSKAKKKKVKPEVKYYRKVLDVAVPFHRILDAEENDGHTCMFMTMGGGTFDDGEGITGSYDPIIGGGITLSVTKGTETRKYIVKAQDVIAAAIEAFTRRTPDGEAS